MNLKRFREAFPAPRQIADTTLSLSYELNSLLAEEYLQWYQYAVVIPFLYGNDRTSVQEFFKTAAEDELNDHAVALINRMNELNIDCSLKSPKDWFDYAKGDYIITDYHIEPQLLANQTTEQQAIAHYQEVISLCEHLEDYTTRDILKHNLADEEQHLSELNDFGKDILK